MRSLTLAIAAAFVLIAPAALAADQTSATAAAVRAADIAFDQRAAAVGAAQAFREYMDQTDSLQFGAGAPTKGAEAIYQAMGGAAPAKGRLEWTPLDSWGSRGGDLGVTTGTWKFTSLKTGEVAATGRYVTVWRKDAKGAWKGLIDIGNPDPK